MCAKRVRINRQGYDSFGSYWGAGAPLYWCHWLDENGNELGEYVRASNRWIAMAKIMREYFE